MRTIVKIVTGVLLFWGLLVLANPVVGNNLDRGIIYHEIGGKYHLGKVQEAKDMATQMRLPLTVEALQKGELKTSEVRALARKENEQKLWNSFYKWGMLPLVAGLGLGVLLCIPKKAI